MRKKFVEIKYLLILIYQLTPLYTLKCMYYNHKCLKWEKEETERIRELGKLKHDLLVSSGIIKEEDWSY